MSVTTSIPLINGVEYAWGDIVAAANGVPFVGITAIKYGDSQDVQNNYGAGRHPEVVALQRQAPNGRLQDIAPFDITVSYLPESGIISTDKIRNCQFTENKVDWKEGDLNLQIELTLIPSHIEWGQPKA